MNNQELIKLIAFKLHLSERQASRCLRVVVDTILEGLEEDECVKIRRLGCLTLVRDTEGGRVVFKDGRVLRRDFRPRKKGERRMDKYGVVIDQDRAAEAHITGKCPDCGLDLPSDGNKKVIHCRQCGSKPFEQRTNEGEDQQG